MATEAHLGGLGAGLQQLMKAGTPVRGQAGMGQRIGQNFATQFRSARSEAEQMVSVPGKSAVVPTPAIKDPGGTPKAKPQQSMASGREADTAAEQPAAVGEEQTLPPVVAGVKAQPASVAATPKSSSQSIPVRVDGRLPPASSPLPKRATSIESAGENPLASSAALRVTNAAGKKAVAMPKTESTASLGHEGSPGTVAQGAPVEATIVTPIPQPPCTAAPASASTDSPGTITVAATPLLEPAKVPGLHGHEAKSTAVASGSPSAARLSEDKAEGSPSVAVPGGQVPSALHAPAPATSGPAADVALGAVASMLAPIERVTSGVSTVLQQASTGQGHAMVRAHDQHDEAHSVGFDGSSAGLSAPHTLVATSQVLEVGITGGAHGWLRVRAELEHTGEVTASLVASNAASADALHKELGAMSAYLKSEAVGVSSLAVNALPKGNATLHQVQGQGAFGGSSSSPGGGMAGGSRNEDGQRAARQTAWAGLTGGGDSPVTRYGAGAVPLMISGSVSGSWLSVRV